MIIETGLIISFATWLGSKIADKGFDAIYTKLTKDSSFDKAFNSCIQKTVNKFEKEYPDILGNSISYFFTQEDVFDELCKLLFVNQELNIEVISETFHEASLPKNFILDFINELKVALSAVPEFQELLANKEIFIAVKGISKGLKELSLNSNLTLEEIKSIKKILQDRFKSKFSLTSFLALYNKNIVNNLGTLNFIGLGIDPSIKKGKRKELEKIFVKPLFELKSKYHFELEKKNKIEYHTVSDDLGENILISYQHLFDRPYNFVILGSPGAGKSLLIKSIVCNIVNEEQKHFTNKRISSYIPFRIELKNYLVFKKERGGNLLKYLSYSLEEEYSVPSILEENLSHIFKNEKSIVFFDGLDEIFNASDKISVKNDIENFHNLFPKIRSIITSRFIGYNEVKLDEKKFCELNIKSFNNDQIEEYVKKWYALEEEDSETRNLETNDFISKMNSIDSELISNPLLLSLIVILYRNNLKIPESKLEIYQSCTNTLVDKWDASKNLDIKISLSILQKKEPIFSDLAFWQYELLSSKNTNITYHQAKKTVAESLIRKKVADEFNSEQLAESFLDYAQKRSIYFDNNFTHKTFLEYYSAYWIYSNVEKKHNVDERNRLIKKYISNPFWFIVLELLLNMIDKDQPDTEIIDKIFEEQLINNRALSFLIYILPNISNISMKVSIEIYKSAINYLININKIDQKRKDVFGRILRNLSSDTQADWLNEAMLSFPNEKRNLNYYFLINEFVFSPRFSNEKVNIKEIIKTEHYISSTKKHPYLFQIDFSYNYQRNEKIEGELFMKRTVEFIELFGQQELFKMHHSKYDNFGLGAFIGYYFYIQLQENTIESIQQNLKVLSENSISDISLIKFIAANGFYFKPSITTLNYLCAKIIKEDTSDKEKLFFIIILKHGLSNRFIRRNDEKIEIDNLSTTSKLKALLRKIKRLNISKYIDNLYIELNMHDKEVLQLTRNIKNWAESAKHE